MENLIIKYEGVKFENTDSFTESEQLQNIYKNFKASISKYHNSKYEICFYLNQLKEFFDKYTAGIKISCNCKLYGLYSFEQFCSAFFNFDRTTIKRYIRVYNKFLKDMSSPYYEKFREFDISKLVELLSVDYEVLCKALDNFNLAPSMSVKHIRNYVKYIMCDVAQNVDNSLEEINEDDIPDCYDPSKHYEDKYFMGLAKSQLINCVTALQKYCETLKTQIKELKNKKKA